MLIDIVYSSHAEISHESAVSGPVEDQLAHMIQVAVRKLPQDLKVALTDARTQAAIGNVLDAMPTRNSLVEGRRQAAIVSEKIQPRRDWTSSTVTRETSKKVRIFKRLAVKYSQFEFWVRPNKTDKNLNEFHFLRS